MRKVVVIDNYDSFTYNLVHYLEALDAEVTVLRNDAFELEDLMGFEKIILSPGPGIPSDAGLLKEVIRKYASSKGILGVCLGQQAIAEVFGGQLINLNQVFHGVSTKIEIIVDDELLFENLPKQIEVGRYHSWIVQAPLPEVLEITALDEEGHVMAFRHKYFDVRAVQFHPESILTPDGRFILQNWFNS